MRRITWAAVMLLALGSGASSSAQSTARPEKERDIRHLLEITGGGELTVQIMERKLAELPGLFAALPPATRDKVVKEFETELRKEFTPAKVVEMLIPIYDKYLTPEEIRAAISFYETPAGQKMVSVTPQIIRESGDAGAARGEEAGRRAIESLRRQGVLPSPGAPPPARPRARRKPAA